MKKLSRLARLTLLVLLLLCLVPATTVFATGSFPNGRTESETNTAYPGYYWDGYSGVRLTIVNRETGVFVTKSMDFRNENNDINEVKQWFGTNPNIKCDKLSYKRGGSINKYKYPDDGKYRAGRFTYTLPTMISSNTMGEASLSTIINFFTRTDVQNAIYNLLPKYADCPSLSDIRSSNKYMIMIEPVAYSKINNVYTAMTATEISLYTSKTGDALGMKAHMPSFTFKKVPLSLFPEANYFNESVSMKITAYTGGTKSFVNDMSEQTSKMGVGFVVFGGGDADYSGEGRIVRYIDNNADNIYNSGDTLVDDKKFAYNYGKSEFYANPYMSASVKYLGSSSTSKGYVTLPYSSTSFDPTKATISGKQYKLKSGYVKKGGSTVVTVHTVPDVTALKLWQTLAYVPSNGATTWYYGYVPDGINNVTIHYVGKGTGRKLKAEEFAKNVKKNTVWSSGPYAHETLLVHNDITGLDNTFKLIGRYYIYPGKTKAQTEKFVGDNKLTLANIKNTAITMPDAPVELYFEYEKVPPEPITIKYVQYVEKTGNHKYDTGDEIIKSKQLYHGRPTGDDYNIVTDGNQSPNHNEILMQSQSVIQ